MLKIISDWVYSCQRQKDGCSQKFLRFANSSRCLRLPPYTLLLSKSLPDAIIWYLGHFCVWRIHPRQKVCLQSSGHIFHFCCLSLAPHTLWCQKVCLQLSDIWPIFAACLWPAGTLTVFNTLSWNWVFIFRESFSSQNNSPLQTSLFSLFVSVHSCTLDTHHQNQKKPILQSPSQSLECLIFTLFWASKKAGLFFCWQ